MRSTSTICGSTDDAALRSEVFRRSGQPLGPRASGRGRRSGHAGSIASPRFSRPDEDSNAGRCADLDLTSDQRRRSCGKRSGSRLSARPFAARRSRLRSGDGVVREFRLQGRGGHRGLGARPPRVRRRAPPAERFRYRFADVGGASQCLVREPGRRRRITSP
ncbi:hypothetical protein AAKU64_003768 [Undibacterium sp. GrIS 1.8]